jgi:hypothetical protein
MVVGRGSELETLVTRAVAICSMHDELLADRLLRILRFPAPKSLPVLEIQEPLEAALTIFSYLRVESQLLGQLCHAQLEACV